jgi:TPR repeat protein
MRKELVYIGFIIGLLGLTGCQKLDLKPHEFMAHAQACDAGDGEKCYYAGLMYEQGIGVEKNNYRARKAYNSGCELGNTSACAQLGKLYLEGK